MKIYRHSLLTIMGLACVVGCADSSSPSEPKTNDTSANEPIATTTKSDYESSLGDDAPTYRVVTFEYSPYKYKDEYGKDIGYDVDIIRAIGEAQGFKTQITQVPYDQLFPAVQSGQYDLAISGLLLRPDRQEIMAYSDPYSKATPGFLVRDESDINEVADVASRKVAHIENGPLKKALEENEIPVGEFVPQPTMFLVFQSIYTGKADAAAGIEAVLQFKSNSVQEYPTRFIPFMDSFYTTIYAPKDEQDVIEQVNQGLAKIKASGEYQKINEKWFGDEASSIAVE